MSSNFGSVQDPTLQKLADRLAQSIRRPDGTTYPAAPNAFQDRYGKTISTVIPSTSQVAGLDREVKIEIRINPDGSTAWCRIESMTEAGVKSLVGQLDPSLFSAFIS